MFLEVNTVADKEALVFPPTEERCRNKSHPTRMTLLFTVAELGEVYTHTGLGCWGSRLGDVLSCSQ